LVGVARAAWWELRTEPVTGERTTTSYRDRTYVHGIAGRWLYSLEVGVVPITRDTVAALLDRVMTALDEWPISTATIVWLEELERMAERFTSMIPQLEASYLPVAAKKPLSTVDAAFGDAAIDAELLAVLADLAHAVREGLLTVGGWLRSAARGGRCAAQLILGEHDAGA
jgi:hypothetical protein